MKTIFRTLAALTALLLFVALFPLRAQEVIEHPSATAETYTDVDGNLWRAYDTGDALVSMSVRYMHYNGQYYLVDLYILNTSDNSIPIEFRDISMYSTRGPVKVFSHNRYLRRMRNRNGWKAFGRGAAVFAAAITIDLLLEGSYQSSSNHSFGETFLTDLAEELVMDAASVGASLIAAHYEEQNRIVTEDNLGYFHDCVIRPNCAVQGHFFAGYREGAEAISVDMPIGGRLHRFMAPTRTLVEVKPQK